MGLFRPYFKFMGIVGESSTAVWLNTRKIRRWAPWQRKGGNDFYQTAPLARLVELFEQGIEPLTKENQRYLVDLAKSRMLAERGDKPGAFDLLKRLNRRFDQLHNPPTYYSSPAVMKQYIDDWVR
jgi:hypothetical protein